MPDKKNFVLAAVLIGMVVVGPVVAYAGITVIYPQSVHTVNVNTSPPITFDDGADAVQAAGLGFANAFTGGNNNASFTLTLSGLSGGTVQIDKYVNVTRQTTVSAYRFQLADDLTGTLTTPTTLKLRAWTGATPPSADGDSQVCGILDLLGATDTTTAANCVSSCDLQLIYTLPNTSTGSSNLAIRASNITFA